MAWISADFSSKTLKMPVEAEILVPQEENKGFSQTEGYQVLILLHGANSDRTEWLLKSQIYEMVKELPIVVFMPSGKNSFYVNTANGYHYMDYITQEIPAFIKKMFRVSHNRKDWLIAGQSMGGYGALVCGLNNPEQFGCIASFCGALDIISEKTHLPEIDMNLIFGHDWEKVTQSNYNIYQLCHKLPDIDKPHIMLSCGKQDRFYEMNVCFYNEIKEEYDAIFIDGDGGDNFIDWNEPLKKLIAWFTSKCKVEFHQPYVVGEASTEWLQNSSKNNMTEVESL